ncbi:hypothetical protein Ctob_015698 [Chrysochromulina tobinii]|uniref:Uncharacterized protein n=1 Tax=Chrysochromulina tobinii TaxID=1460289 RepID=A0A0M0KA24_9EUKA|nr:hypothetical protein Ctob_015698 [Chrysochromulina tobinii]|eukprot:KOO35696.1 hypothetical protein Ctob_015698 [Chrysochromulina sp. CCMP291]
MTTSGPMAILGIPFLREYAVYFDRASWGMSVAQIEEGSSVCSQCGTTFASRLIEHISGSSETALAAGSSALQPEAITATMSSNNVRRAAPIKQGLAFSIIVPGVSIALRAKHSSTERVS